MNKYIIIFTSIVLSAFACDSKMELQEDQITLDDILPANAKVEKLAGGFNFLEGPVWDKGNDRLVFSEVGGNKLHQWTSGSGVSTYLEPSYYAGGNVFDEDGSIISCQGGARQVARVKTDKTVEVLTNNWDGKKFNSPNDVIVKSDGTVWFTDPDYGLLAIYGENADDFREIDKFHIFVFDPVSNSTKSVFSELSKPNGLVFSKDEQQLFVGNSEVGDRKLVVFDVTSANELENMEVIASIDSETWGIDGLKMDEFGNLYAACGDGINIFSPEGELLGKINTDFEVTNLCFGGEDKQTLFLTGHEGLYKIGLNVKGK